MNIKKLILWSCLFLIGHSVFAQKLKQVIDREQVWTAYFNQTRLTNKFGFWFDGHLRLTDNFLDKFSTGILRLVLTYYVNDHVKLTAGYAYINHFSADGHKNISQPEHCP